MKNIGSIIWKFIGHNKYWLVIIIGILIVGFIDENSFVKRIQYSMEKSDLEEQIKEYNDQYARDKEQLRQLSRNPEAIRKIARERYFMKTDDEDIFVLSDDIEEKETDETAQ
ncbi:MAG: septum formation initiator family protein [Prevotella sp.]|nr:septum formation initiator family protein [Prevotella sp.]MBQ8702363.1 septum formation initiator family protein [Prevotella sp.]MBQ9652292.1 septum formation initiator family protein [Prevotella sp.]